MKKVLLIITMLALLMMIGCNKDEKIENNNLVENTTNEQPVINNDNIDNNNDNKNDNEEETKEKKVFSLDEETANEYIKLIGKYLDEYPDYEQKYELIYFDNNDIPDLLIDLGSIANLFEYESGEMKTIIDRYSYGTHGRWPCYYEKKGVLTDFATDGTNGWGVEYYELVDGKLELTYSRSGKIEGEAELVENGKLIADIENDSSIRFLDDFNNCTLSNIINTIDSSVINESSKITKSSIDNIIESREFQSEDLKYSFPFLKIDSNDVAKINLKLRLKEIGLFEGNGFWISEVNYKYSYINSGDVLSLVVNYIDSDSHDITHNGAETFNVDVKTGKLLKTSEIYSQDDLKDKIMRNKDVKSRIEGYHDEEAGVYVPDEIDDIKIYVLNNEYHVIVELFGTPGSGHGYADIILDQE